MCFVLFILRKWNLEVAGLNEVGWYGCCIQEQLIIWGCGKRIKQRAQSISYVYKILAVDYVFVLFKSHRATHTSRDTNLLPYLSVCFSVSLVRVNQEAGDVAEDGLGEVGHF